MQIATTTLKSEFTFSCAFWIHRSCYHILYGDTTYRSMGRIVISLSNYCSL